jgi:hypothetical protein
LKTLLVICAAVLLLQSLTIWKADSSADKSPPKQADLENGAWKPPQIVRKAEAYLDDFRPRITLPWDKHRVGLGASETVTFEKGDTNGRVAKFRLTEGSAVRITYQDPRDGQLKYTCLCSEGGLAGVTPLPDCGKGFRASSCPTEGLITVYEEQGKFLLQGLGIAGGTIQQY